jgi:hypothetical protein
MQDLKVHASDHSTVSNFGFKYVRSGSGECVRVADDPDLYIGHGKAKVQACEWFEKIVATVFENLFTIEYKKVQERVRREPVNRAQYERNLRLFHEVGRRDEENERRKTFSRATPGQVETARDATRMASGAACASAARRTKGGPKPKRAVAFGRQPLALQLLVLWRLLCLKSRRVPSSW